MTFVLTNRGHNAGIVSEPGHAGRHYRIATTPFDAPFRDADDWRDDTAPQDGSWWAAYTLWLKARSGPVGHPPSMGQAVTAYSPLCAAPGGYVLQA